MMCQKMFVYDKFEMRIYLADGDGRDTNLRCNEPRYPVYNSSNVDFSVHDAPYLKSRPRSKILSGNG